jgi:hypothetical protein
LRVGIEKANDVDFLCCCELYSRQDGQFAAFCGFDDSGHVGTGIVIGDRDQVGVGFEGAFDNEGGSISSVAQGESTVWIWSSALRLFICLGLNL